MFSGTKSSNKTLFLKEKHHKWNYLRANYDDNNVIVSDSDND